MDNPNKILWESLNKKGLYTKSYEDFSNQFASKEASEKLFNALSEKKLYTKSFEDFSKQFGFEEVKKKDDTDSLLETASLDSGGKSKSDLEGNLFFEWDTAKNLANKGIGFLETIPAETTRLVGNILSGMGGVLDLGGRYSSSVINQLMGYEKAAKADLAKTPSGVAGYLIDAGNYLAEGADVTKKDVLQKWGVKEENLGGDKSFVDTFSNGELSDGTAMLLYDVLATVPQFAAAMLTGGGSLEAQALRTGASGLLEQSALGEMAALSRTSIPSLVSQSLKSTAGGQFKFGLTLGTSASIQEKYKEDGILTATDFLESLASGVVEGISETLFDTDIRAARSIASKFIDVSDNPTVKGILRSIAEEGEQASREKIVRTAGDIFKKTVLGGGQEGLEEVASSFGNLLIDAAKNGGINAQSLEDFKKDATQAFIVGALSGGGISGVAAKLSRVKLTDNQKKSIERYNEIIDGDFSDESKQLARTRVKEIIDFNTDLSRNNYRAVAALQTEDRVEALDYLSKIDKLQRDKKDSKDLAPDIDKAISEYEGKVQDLISKNEARMYQEYIEATKGKIAANQEAAINFIEGSQRVQGLDNRLSNIRAKVASESDINENQVKNAVTDLTSIIDEIMASEELTDEQKEIAAEPYYNEISNLEDYEFTVRTSVAKTAETAKATTIREVSRTERPKTIIQSARFDGERVEYTTRDGTRGIYDVKVGKKGGLELQRVGYFTLSAEDRRDIPQTIKLDNNRLTFKESFKDNDGNVIAVEMTDERTGETIKVNNPDLAIDLAIRAKQLTLGNVSDVILERAIDEVKLGENKQVIREYINRNKKAQQDQIIPIDEAMNQPSRKRAFGIEVSDEMNLEDSRLKRKFSPVQKIKLSNYRKALNSVSPETRIVFHEDEESFSNGLQESGYTLQESDEAALESKGVYDSKGNVIHINAQRFDATTIPHEIFHPIVAKLAKENPQEFITMKNAVIKHLKQSKIKELENFASQYEGEEVQAEEFLAQLAGLLTSNQAEFKRSFLYKLALDVKAFLKRIAKKLKMNSLDKFADSLFTEQSTEEEILQFFEGFAQSLQKGEAIDTKALKGKAEEFINEVDNYIRQQKRAERRILFHGGENKISKFNESNIKGGTRGELGYGYYFSQNTKALDYGNIISYLDSTNLNFINEYDEVDDSFINKMNSLNISNAVIEKINDEYNKRKDNNENTEISQIRKNVISSLPIDAEKQFSELMVKLGYDGMTAMAGNSINQVVLYPQSKLDDLLISVPNLEEVPPSYKTIVQKDIDQLIDEGKSVITDYGVVGKINSEINNTGRVIDKSSIKKQIDEKAFDFKRFEGMEKNITTGLSLKDIGDVIAHLTFSDRLTAGIINGKSYFGGILFPATTGNWWAAQTIGKANQFVKNAKANKDGYKYMIPALMSAESHLSNNDMLNASIALIEDRINQDKVSLEEANNRILKALSLKDTSKYAEVYNNAIKKGLTKENINKGIEDALIGSNATFDARKSFVKSILGNANIKVEKRFAGIPSFTELAQYFAEPLSDGLEFGDIPLIVRTKGDLYVVEPKEGEKDYHPSYKFIIKSTEKIETIVFDKAYNAIDIYPEVYNSKGELISYKGNYVSKYGEQAKSRYLSWIGGGQMSTVVSRDIKTSDLKQQKLAKQKEESFFQASIDEANKVKKVKLKELKNIFKKYTTERNINVKQAFEEDDMTLPLYLMYNKAGSSMFGELKYEQKFVEIYKDLNKTERTRLDDVIMLRRIIAIDDNFDNRAAEQREKIAALKKEKEDTQKFIKTASLTKQEIASLKKDIESLTERINKENKNLIERPKHPQGYTKEIAMDSLNTLKGRIGADAFNLINNRAEMYFNEFSNILKEKLDAGLIDEATYNLYKDYEYSPRKFLEFLIGTEDARMMDRGFKATANSFYNAGMGISRKELMNIEEGSLDYIYMDSAELLRMAMISTQRKIFTNRALEAVYKEGFRKNVEWLKEVEYLRDKNGNILVNEDGSLQYNTKPAKNFRIVQYKKNGVVVPFQMKELLAREFFDEELWDKNSKAYKLAQTLSGANILRNMATGINLSFPITNIPVDVISQVQVNNIYDGMDVGMAGQYAKAFGGTISYSYEALMNTEKFQELAYEFGNAGGLMMTLSEEYRSKDKIIAGVSKYLSSLGNASEIGSKLNAYVVKRDELISKYKKDNNGKQPTGDALLNIQTEAAFIARGAMDYHRGGLLSKWVDGFIPYLNVTLQGFKITGKYIQDNPVKFVNKINQVGLGLMALTMYNMWAAGDDYDNDDNQYDLLNKIVIFSPFKNEDGTRYKATISLPAPIKGVLNVYQSLAENAFYKLNGQPDKMTDVKAIAYQRLIKMFYINIGVSAMPPVLRSLVEYRFNIDLWRNRSITNDFQELLVEKEGFDKEFVGDFYQVLGDVTGLSPARSQKVAENFLVPSNPLSGIANVILDKTASAAANIPESQRSRLSKEDIGKVALEPFNVIAKRIIKKTDPTVVYKDNNDEINRIVQEGATRRREIRVEIEDMYKKRVSVDKFNDYIKSLNNNSEIRTATNTIEGLRKRNSLEMPDNFYDYLEIKNAGSNVDKAKVLYFMYPNLLEKDDPTVKVLMSDLKKMGAINAEIASEYIKIQKERQK